MQIFPRLFFAFFALNCFLIRAQTTTDTSKFNGADYSLMVELELSSSRLPVRLSESGMHVTVITQAEIKALPVQNVNELLTYISGIDIRQRGPMGTQSDIGIRGSTFDQVLVMVDGVRMTDPQTGHHQMNLPVPLQMIERIEVIRGTAARRYGLNALGGVVQIITKKHSETPFAFESFGMGITDNNPNAGLNGGLRLFAGGEFSNWQVMGGAEGLKGNGYRWNTDFEQLRTFLKVSNEGELGSFSLLGGTNNNDFGAGLFYAAPRDSNARETVNTQFASAQFQSNLGDKDKLTLTASGRWNFDHYIYTQFNPTLYQNKHQNQAIQMEASYLHFFNDSRLAFGIESRSEKITSNNLGNHSREILGVYGEYIHQWTPEFSTTIGGYALHTDFIGFKVYPGAEFQYKILESSSLWGNFGTGQRLPTYTDWYYKDGANLSNPNLKSERARNSELGYRYQKGKWSAQFSIFQKDYTDIIDWVRNNDTLKWKPENISTLQFRGAEWEIRLKEFLPILPEGTELVWNGCVLRSSQLDLPGLNSKNALNYMPLQNTLRFRVKLWEGPDGLNQTGLYFSGIWRHISRFSSNSYNIIDAKLEFSRGKSWNAYLNGMNLGNIQYREIASVPMMPRWIGLGIAAQL